MYITGEGSLPEPLCESEEKDALSKLKSGDSAIREKLIVHNLRLVVYIAKKFDNTGLDQDDLISVGTIGLIKAVGSFDPDQKHKACNLCFEMHRKRNSYVSEANGPHQKRNFSR